MGRVNGVLFLRSFEKGLADRRGCREEILSMPETGASSLYHFSYAPSGEGGHISGEFVLLCFGVCLSPTPSRQPLFETSEFRTVLVLDVLRVVRIARLEPVSKSAAESHDTMPLSSALEDASMQI